MNAEYYTPEQAGSGQFGICVKCKKPPTAEGHDGCLGILLENLVMNACCGHGSENMAYVQYYDRPQVEGRKALNDIELLKLLRRMKG